MWRHWHSCLDCDNPTQRFTSLIYQAGEEAIPQTSTTPKRPHKPWFDEDCKIAIGTRKSAPRQFDPRPTHENHVKFEIARAKVLNKINARVGDGMYLSMFKL